eukprot:1013689_1
MIRRENKPNTWVYIFNITWNQAVLNHRSRVEKTHSVSSTYIKRSGVRIKGNVLTPKVLAKDNRIVSFLMKLMFGSQPQKKLLYFILDEANRVNMAESQRIMYTECKQSNALKNTYFKEHMKMKRTRRKKSKQSNSKAISPLNPQESQQQESPSDPNKNQPKSRKNKKRIVREYETDPDLQEIENNSSTYEVDENLNNMNYTNHGMTRRTRSKKVRYNTDEQYSWIDKLQ